MAGILKNIQELVLFFMIICQIPICFFLFLQVSFFSPENLLLSFYNHQLFFVFVLPFFILFFISIFHHYILLFFLLILPEFLCAFQLLLLVILMTYLVLANSLQVLQSFLDIFILFCLHFLLSLSPYHGLVSYQNLMHGQN